MKSRADSGLIRPIQYLRAVSALVVVWVHALYIIPGVVDRLGKPYFEPSAAIDVFFLVSGFIMVVTTMRKDMRPAQFFCIRLVRIVPLYWLATLGVVACAVAGHSFQGLHYSALAVVKSSLFIPFAAIEGAPGSVWPILQQGWTLNYEMFFYILFAISLAAPRQWRHLGLCAVLAALVLAGRIFGPFAGPLASVYTNPLLVDFAAGMVLAYLWMRSAPGDWLPYPLLVVLVGLCALGSNLRAVTMSGAIIIFAGCLHPSLCSTRNSLLMGIGNASYSMYLSHQFVLDSLASLWMRVFQPVTWISSAIFMGVALCCCAITGYLCFRFVENPMTSYLLALLARSTSSERNLTCAAS